ncbi:hypothetical protein [Cellulomonas sp. ATA003]|uniref:hypothetical protein n=1 Tax=Cellulomonas sp. ATA003 TaxID=3073064 RepID=UPI0028737F89|nr:hypothetical protein [Cellulomonas sp. ATA003]WNB85045.1 hypothetical protein REH70_15425 [Cellulomonas sp. ATA003]
MPRRTTPPDRARPRPAASSASSPPPLPSSARAGGVDPLFTELDTRRLGPVRRYFVRHPVAMDRLVAALYAVPAIGAALLEETAPSADAEVTLRGGPAAAVLLAVAVLGGVALLWRRRAPCAPRS